MSTATLKAYPARERAQVLRQARDAGVVPYDVLDRLLVDACETPRRLKALLRSLEDVRVVDADDSADPLNVDLSFEIKLDGPASDKAFFDAYADRVRQLPRLTRHEEQILARRLEFHRTAIEQVLDEHGLSDEAKENVLRGCRCAVIEQGLQSIGKRGKVEKLTEQLPCASASERSPMQARCHEYNRLREHLTERNLALVVGMAHAYRTYGLPLMDLVQEGNASLIRAVEKFDWRKGVRFQTYATFWIRQAIERLITANRGMVRVPNYIQQKLRRLRREGKLPRDHREMDVGDVSKQFDTTAVQAVRLMETDRNWYSLDATAGDDEGGSYSARIAAEEEDLGITGSERELLGRRLEEVMEDELTEQERDILSHRFGLGGRVPKTLDQIGETMRLSRERIRQMQMKAIDKLGRPHLLPRLEDFL